MLLDCQTCKNSKPKKERKPFWRENRDSGPHRFVKFCMGAPYLLMWIEFAEWLKECSHRVWATLLIEFSYTWSTSKLIDFGQWAFSTFSTKSSRIPFFFRWQMRCRLSNTAAKSGVLRPVTMETRCFHKKLEFQRYPPKDFCTACYEHRSSKKEFQTFQNPPRKYFLGRSWAKIGLRKTQPNVCSKRRNSESSTDIDGQNQRLRHEIWTGRAR